MSYTLFYYSEFEGLVKFLSNTGFGKEYFVHYCDFINNRNKLELISKLDSKKPESKTILNIYINFPIDYSLFKKANDILRKLEIHSKFIFIIENEKDVALSEEIADNYKLPDYSFIPFYNTDNLPFFKQHIFINKIDILNSNPTQENIFIRQVVNPLNFGKLTILSNGNIYGNTNDPALGEITKNSPAEIIYKELTNGKSWTKRRQYLQPCKNCVYNLLCPPISNYEIVLGKNNLCHIKN